MREALYYEILADGRVKCLLCPHYCVIAVERTGFCGVRKNIGRKLYSLVYGEITSIALDPIEKKPLYHWHPGEFILSIGTKGCNFKCGFCQNWGISQDLSCSTESITAEYLIKEVKRLNSFGIAYTYNEPFIWYEFILDTAKKIKLEGLENVLVTNGYINLEPLEELLPYIDAANIDLKSIEDSFYRETCKGDLNTVLEVIKKMYSSCHIEITNLVIPTLNDREENFVKLVDWIYENLGDSIPLHFSRYFPCYKFNIPSTPIKTLKKAEEIARKKLKYVYLGNVSTLF